jgi:hypothetical protein
MVIIFLKRMPFYQGNVKSEGNKAAFDRSLIAQQALAHDAKPVRDALGAAALRESQSCG